jgi:hypothetical protein
MVWAQNTSLNIRKTQNSTFKLFTEIKSVGVVHGVVDDGGKLCAGFILFIKEDSIINSKFIEAKKKVMKSIKSCPPINEFLANSDNCKKRELKTG